MDKCSFKRGDDHLTHGIGGRKNFRVKKQGGTGDRNGGE